MTVEIGHAGALAPHREAGRVERANERRRARGAEVDGARGDGTVRGGDDCHREVISVHERHYTSQSAPVIDSAKRTYRRNSRDSRCPAASILLPSRAVHPAVLPRLSDGRWGEQEGGGAYGAGLGIAFEPAIAPAV